MRYLLLDRITELAPPLARGIKCVSLGEDMFVDHFPGHPIMPGALLVEGMAQLGGVLLEQAMRDRGRKDLHALLVTIDRAKFRRAVRPGDRVELEAQVRAVNEDGGQLGARAVVDGALAAEAELTYAFARVTNPVLIARRKEFLDIWLNGTLE